MIDFTQASAIPEQEAVVDDRGFAALVQRQSRFIFRVAYALLRNSHDAEDAVQETFLRVYRKGAWRTMENERGFLARTAWRIALDKLRKVRHETLEEDLTPDSKANPEQAALDANWNAAVHRLVDALPLELRQPLALATVEGMTSREIAKVMGIPEGTVRSRTMRARQILKQKLAGLMEGRDEKR